MAPCYLAPIKMTLETAEIHLFHDLLIVNTISSSLVGPNSKAWQAAYGPGHSLHLSGLDLFQVSGKILAVSSWSV